MSQTSQSVAGSRFSVEPLPDSTFGIRITGLDPADLDDPALCAQLYDLWIEHGLILFKALYGRDTLVKLSRIFGPLLNGLVREIQSNDNPEVIRVVYDPETGWLMNVDGERMGSWQPWHIDGIYDKNPNRGGIIAPISTPTTGGETGFINSMATYEALPDDLKEEIADLRVIYRLDPIRGFEQPRFGRKQKVVSLRYSASVSSVNTRLDDYPMVSHPLVFEHPESGRKVLNLSPLFAEAIQGMDKARSDELLHRLSILGTDETYAYFHSYEPGDMLLWDNWRILHCAKGCPPDELRVMERTTIAGDYGLGAMA